MAALLLVMLIGDLIVGFFGIPNVAEGLRTLSRLRPKEGYIERNIDYPTTSLAEAEQYVLDNYGTSLLLDDGTVSVDTLFSLAAYSDFALPDRIAAAYGENVFRSGQLNSLFSYASIVPVRVLQVKFKDGDADNKLLSGIISLELDGIRNEQALLKLMLPDKIFISFSMSLKGEPLSYTHNNDAVIRINELNDKENAKTLEVISGIAKDFIAFENLNTFIAGAIVEGLNRLNYHNDRFGDRKYMTMLVGFSDGMITVGSDHSALDDKLGRDADGVNSFLAAVKDSPAPDGISSPARLSEQLVSALTSRGLKIFDGLKISSNPVLDKKVVFSDSEFLALYNEMLSGGAITYYYSISHSQFEPEVMYFDCNEENNGLIRLKIVYKVDISKEKYYMSVPGALLPDEIYLTNEFCMENSQGKYRVYTPADNDDVNRPRLTFNTLNAEDSAFMAQLFFSQVFGTPDTMFAGILAEFLNSDGIGGKLSFEGGQVVFDKKL